MADADVFDKSVCLTGHVERIGALPQKFATQFSFALSVSTWGSVVRLNVHRVNMTVSIKIHMILNDTEKKSGRFQGIIWNRIIEVGIMV